MTSSTRATRNGALLGDTIGFMLGGAGRVITDFTVATATHTVAASCAGMNGVSYSDLRAASRTAFGQLPAPAAPARSIAIAKGKATA